MNKIATFMVALCAIVVMACNSNNQTEKKAVFQHLTNDAGEKCLVLYYSQTGNTDTVASQLQKALRADMEAIEVEEPYSGTYDQTIARCKQEQEKNIVPKIKPLQANIADYDVVFIGYPIWFGTYARPIMGLLAEQDFAGKRVVPFCTFGSGGLEASTADLRAALPKAQVLDGYGVRMSRIDAVPAELNRFLVENSYVKGEVDKLPDFSKQEPVNAEEEAVFNRACGDYQFPLGTPVTVGKRELKDATEYKFITDSSNPDGSKVEATIYVLCENGKKPVFTKVVR